MATSTSFPARWWARTPSAPARRPAAFQALDGCPRQGEQWCPAWWWARTLWPPTRWQAALRALGGCPRPGVRGFLAEATTRTHLVHRREPDVHQVGDRQRLTERQPRLRARGWTPAVPRPHRRARSHSSPRPATVPPESLPAVSRAVPLQQRTGISPPSRRSPHGRSRRGGGLNGWLFCRVFGRDHRVGRRPGMARATTRPATPRGTAATLPGGGAMAWVAPGRPQPGPARPRRLKGTAFGRAGPCRARRLNERLRTPEGLSGRDGSQSISRPDSCISCVTALRRSPPCT